MTKNLILITLIFCIYTVKSDNPGHLTLLGEASSSAVCLDGSPGAYYFRNGSESA